MSHHQISCLPAQINKADADSTFRVTPAGVRAELGGDDSASALGITVRSPSPVLSLCRALVEARCDPRRPLDVYRGNTLALRIKSIGQAAKLRVAPHGVGFVLDTPADERQPRPFDPAPAGRPHRCSPAVMHPSNSRERVPS